LGHFMSTGYIFNIERYTLHDGPGIRTTVFFKGCPLRCLWCSNPESQLKQPQVFFIEELCNGCGRCVDICPKHAISMEKAGQPVQFQFEQCNGCGECMVVCYRDALVLAGKEVAASEIAEQVGRDKVFYRYSNGGVTLSGGEPLSQAQFAADILQLCKENGIHTAIQTCCYADKEQIDLVMPFLDLAIIDIKHLDRFVHRSFTGKDNDLILENVRYIDHYQSPIIIQIPLIPDINDSDETLAEIFHFAAGLKNLSGVSLLAYHTLGIQKYKRLGRPYSMPDLEIPKNYLQDKINTCERFGLPIIQFGG